MMKVQEESIECQRMRQRKGRETVKETNKVGRDNQKINKNVLATKLETQWEGREMGDNQNKERK